MIVYHVTTLKKIQKYMQQGIKPPVRAWKTIQEAERFSKQTGRRFIMRLKFPNKPKKLEGHKGQAVVIEDLYFDKGW